MAENAPTARSIVDAADAFISELRSRAYGPGTWSNKLEGDLGTWDDWRDALVEFATARIRAGLSAMRVCRRCGVIATDSHFDDGSCLGNWVPSGSAFDIAMRAAELLRTYQWANHEEIPGGLGGTMLVGLCPECDQTQERGHSPDCRIGAVLAEITAL